ncbi:MAG: hypothetical protein K5837_03505 [Candidatus Saccharibacteria bacterium]|nr:hypothetical protein [Candidatus Saccharibacteria bacterium]
MIKIFYGNDRQKAQEAVNKILGKEYELIEADSITRADMDSIFRGTSLFGENRKILLKDLSENKECWESFPNYLDTTHDVVVWLSTLDKRSVTYKNISKNKAIEFKEFAVEVNVDRFLAFKVFDEAFAGHGARAVKMCEELEQTSDAYLTMGAFVSQSGKKLEIGKPKATSAIKILAKADLDMKSTAIDGWEILKIALLKISSTR